MLPIWRHPTHLLAFGFGAGLSSRAPGTAGTLVGVVFYYALNGLPFLMYIAATAVLFAGGIWLCGRTARDLNVHDHPGIVWDEIVGYLVTMTAAPRGWAWVLFGFLLFRLFDIAKPWPIHRLDKEVSGGIGIMIDDLLAGLYGLAVLQLAAALLDQL